MKEEIYAVLGVINALYVHRFRLPASWQAVPVSSSCAIYRLFTLSMQSTYFQCQFLHTCDTHAPFKRGGFSFFSVTDSVTAGAPAHCTSMQQRARHEHNICFDGVGRAEDESGVQTVCAFRISEPGGVHGVAAGEVQIRLAQVLQAYPCRTRRK